MGKEIRRELNNLIPAKAIIVEHIDYVYACCHCETDAYGVPIIKAPMDKPVINGSGASAEAVAPYYDAEICEWDTFVSPGARIQSFWHRPIGC
jgi:hypothetical protein